MAGQAIGEVLFGLVEITAQETRKRPRADRQADRENSGLEAASPNVAVREERGFSGNTPAPSSLREEVSAPRIRNAGGIRRHRVCFGAFREST